MRTGTRAVAVCAVVCLHAGVAAAQSRVVTLPEVLARARDRAPQIVSARLALEESRADDLRCLVACSRQHLGKRHDRALRSGDAGV